MSRSVTVTLTALLLTVSLALARPGAARADTIVIGDVDAVRADKHLDAAVSAIILRPFTDGFGAMGYTFVTPEYAEGYVGPAFFVGPLRFGVGAGIEQHDPSFRIGLIASLELEPISILGSLETGGSGPFGSIEGIYRLGKAFGVGAQATGGLGIGPRIEVNTPWSFSVHAAGLLDPMNGHDSEILGVRAYLD